MRRPSEQLRAQQQRPPQHERTVDVVPWIRTEHVDMTAQSAQEVGRLRTRHRHRALLEASEGRMGAAGEDEDGWTDRPRYAALHEDAILHRCQEPRQPPELASFDRGIELIPKD